MPAVAVAAGGGAGAGCRGDISGSEESISSDTVEAPSTKRGDNCTGAARGDGDDFTTNITTGNPRYKIVIKARTHTRMLINRIVCEWYF